MTRMWRAGSALTSGVGGMYSVFMRVVGHTLVDREGVRVTSYLAKGNDVLAEEMSP